MTANDRDEQLQRASRALMQAWDVFNTLGLFEYAERTYQLANAVLLERRGIRRLDDVRERCPTCGTNRRLRPFNERMAEYVDREGRRYCNASCYATAQRIVDDAAQP